MIPTVAGDGSVAAGVGAIVAYGVADACHDLLLAPSRALTKRTSENESSSSAASYTIMSMIGRTVAFAAGVPRRLVPFRPEKTAHARSLIFLAALVVCFATIGVATVHEETRMVPVSPSSATRPKSLPLPVLVVVSMQTINWICVCTWAFYYTAFLGTGTLSLPLLGELEFAYVAGLAGCLCAVGFSLVLERINARCGTRRVSYLGTSSLAILMIIAGLFGGQHGTGQRSVIVMTTCLFHFGYVVTANNAYILVDKIVSDDLGRTEEDGWSFSLVSASLSLAQFFVGAFAGLVASARGDVGQEERVRFLFVVTGVACLTLILILGVFVDSESLRGRDTQAARGPQRNETVRLDAPLLSS